MLQELLFTSTFHKCVAWSAQYGDNFVQFYSFWGDSDAAYHLLIQLRSSKCSNKYM